MAAYNSPYFIRPSVGNANKKEHRYWAPTLYRRRCRRYHEQRQVMTSHQLEVVPPGGWGREAIVAVTRSFLE